MTGELAVLAENPGHVYGWLWGADGELFARTLTEEGDFALSRWNATAGELALITTFDGADYPVGINPFEMAPDGAGVWTGSTRGTDLIRGFRIDLATGAETEVDNHPTLELDGSRRAVAGLSSRLIRNRRTARCSACATSGNGRRSARWTRASPPYCGTWRRSPTETSESSRPTTAGSDGSRTSSTTATPRSPTTTTTSPARAGCCSAPTRTSPRTQWPPTRPVTITARDGLALPPYLTLPVGIEPSALPMVLLAHGGPWFRDSWGFDPEVQMLANRGYAVLQGHAGPAASTARTRAGLPGRRRDNSDAAFQRFGL
ncbi:alpha/beta hydrolase family protein [Streptomyces decoyicus]|uniref:alpha/beta hydrolase family protein n=1 Tax=Streptomyces decoyicus TaxID=249567 RepID=UPI00365A2965